MTVVEAVARGVVPVWGCDQQVIGTGAVVGLGLVVTALHVVDAESTGALRVANQLPVAAAVGLPLRRFGAARHLARWSYDRARDLCGIDIGTVDLALLAVPDLADRPLELRNTPVERDDHVVVAGFPAGHYRVAAGPVTSRDDADFVADVVLGSGGCGSPALDPDGLLAGIATVDHSSVGGVFVGPELLAAFLDRAIPLVAHTLKGTPT